MSYLNFELNIQKYSLTELKNLFHIKDFNFTSIKNKVSEKVSDINILDISSIEKKEIISFLEVAEHSLLKDLEISILKQKQKDLVDEIDKLKKNILK